MNENEKFIRDNIPSLLLDRRVKSKAEEIGGEWKLDEVHCIHPMPSNIGFAAAFHIDANRSVNVVAKIHRENRTFSNVEVQVMGVAKPN
jgi:hypothetical protein